MTFGARQDDGGGDIAFLNGAPLHRSRDIPQRPGVHDPVGRGLMFGEPARQLVGVSQDLFSRTRHQRSPFHGRYLRLAAMAWTMTGPSSPSTTPTSTMPASLAGPINMVKPSPSSSVATAFRTACSMPLSSIPCRRALSAMRYTHKQVTLRRL